MDCVEAPSWIVAADDDAQEFLTDERCYITELLNSDAAPQSSLALARVEPGVTTQLHALAGITEVYVIRKGRGVVEIEGLQQNVSVGDKVLIAADVAQRITCTGDEDLEFYCVCTPRFSPECYINLELQR